MKTKLYLLSVLVLLGATLFISDTARASHENELKFTGAIESLPGNGLIGDWRVAGRTVHVSSATEIEQQNGQVAVGATVKVEGNQRADGSVDATEIEVNSGGGNSGGGNSGGGNSGGGSGSGSGGDNQNEANFKGTIQSFPAGFVGNWTVGGRTIHVTAATKIETEFGPVAVGAFVEVKGTVRTDNSIDATKIEVKSNVTGDDGRHELKGTITSLPSGSLIGNWVVAGTTVSVTSSTIINQEHGAAVVGAAVEVHGSLLANGTFEATRIEVQPTGGNSGGNNGGNNNSEGQPATVKGPIQSLPGSVDFTGDWQVRDTVIHVTSSTKRITEHGQFAVGVAVKVKGLRLADGSIVATKIQVRDSQ